MPQDWILFSGTAHPRLASAIAEELAVRLGACEVERFPDGETTVRLDEPVRGRDIFLIQPTAPPVNDHLVELLAFADACRRSAAARITAIIPYFGYARSDKRHGGREPIVASLVARLMQAAGIDHVVTLDLHAAQIEGFFHVPVESLTAVPTLTHAMRDRLEAGTAVVSPDTGRVAMASEYAHRLRGPVAVLHKRRLSGTETEVTHVVGDVQGRPCLIIDDMISTGGTILRAVDALRAAGACAEISVAATHGVFVGDALEKLGHKGLRALYVTDTLPVADRAFHELHIVSIAPLIASAIRRLQAGESLAELY